MAVTWWRVKESKSPYAHRVDFAGFLFLTSGLVALVYGIIRAGEKSWTETGVIVCLALGAGLLAAFVVTELIVEHPLFELSLFKTPTFVGGSAAAVAMNGSLFAMLLYIALYLQDLLGYSPLQTGVRLLVLSGATLIAATASGILSERIPARYLVGPGLILVALGLFLMTGLHADSSWTHLVPGMIVAGIGSGLVNPPLASTAVGVVHPAKSGMASGVNSTFRQVGIAAGIAVYGSVFASQLGDRIARGLSGQPGLASRVTINVRSGNVPGALQTVSTSQQPHLADVIRTSFTDGMNHLFIISAIVALTGGILSLLLIRRQDFITTGTSATTAEPTMSAAAPA